LRHILLLALVLQVVSAASPVQDRFAVRGARLLDPRSGRVLTPAVVITRGDRIVEVLEGEPARRAVVDRDLGDSTLLPGLIDGHVHLEIGGTPRANARATLQAGFTTVVDLGAVSDAVSQLRRDIEGGKGEGPSILVAGRWIGRRGGICDFSGIGLPDEPGGFRERVQANVAAGADLLKVCVSGWPAASFVKPDAYEIADATLRITVEAAHAEKRVVVAHAISAGAVRASIEAGVNGLAHAAYIDAPTAARMRARDMFLIPTLASLLRSTDGPAADGLRSGVSAAYAAGVPLVFGTDAGVLPHGENAREFLAMSAAGVSPLDAIRSATVRAADAFGGGGELGVLEAGRAADIIAVRGDPLADLSAMQRVTFVMRRGRGL
jgi:imidazolonepropionase-like amidohydrolase